MPSPRLLILYLYIIRCPLCKKRGGVSLVSGLLFTEVSPLLAFTVVRRQCVAVLLRYVPRCLNLVVFFSGIRWQDLVPGRLLHVRFCCPSLSLDLVCCYQHYYGSKSSPAFDSKDRLWCTLHVRLRQRPLRNLLVLAGDIKQSVATLSPYIGHACPDAS